MKAKIFTLLAVIMFVAYPTSAKKSLTKFAVDTNGVKHEVIFTRKYAKKLNVYKYKAVVENQTVEYFSRSKIKTKHLRLVEINEKWYFDLSYMFKPKPKKIKINKLPYLLL